MIDKHQIIEACKSKEAFERGSSEIAINLDRDNAISPYWLFINTQEGR